MEPADPRSLDRLRSEMVRAAQGAYEQARIAGLCAEGAFEMALDAIRNFEPGIATRTSTDSEPDADRARSG